MSEEDQSKLRVVAAQLSFQLAQLRAQAGEMDASAESLLFGARKIYAFLGGNEPAAR